MTRRICSIGLPTEVFAIRMSTAPGLGQPTELAVQMAEENGYGPMLGVMCEHPERADVILALAAREVCRRCKSPASCALATIMTLCRHKGTTDAT